jgi:hypothetical protein
MFIRLLLNQNAAKRRKVYLYLYQDFGIYNPNVTNFEFTKFR